MADKPPTPKVKGKLPKWAIPVGIAVALAAIIVLKKRKSTGKATEPGAEGLTNQSFIPVTGENVAGMGTPFGGSSGSSNNEGLLTNFLKEQQQENTVRQGEERVANRESIEREQSFFQQIISNLGTGGGAPNSSGAPGTTTAPAPPATTPGPSPPPYTPPPAPPPAPPAPSCGPGWIWNPADGAPGPHSCWKYSRDRCPAPRIYKHVYQDGHVVCAST